MHVIRIGGLSDPIRVDRDVKAGAVASPAAGPASQRSGLAGKRETTIPADGRCGRHGGAPPRRHAPLRPTDFAMLAVLGVVHEGFAAFDDILAAAKALAEPDWQPTADVLAAAMTRALDQALVCKTSAGYAATPDGIGCLRDLLEAPPASSRGAVARTAAALKVCFLGVLDEVSRQDVLDELIVLHRRDLDALVEGCAGCPAAGVCPRLWIAREIARMKSEIAWLCDLKESFPTT